MPDEQPALFPGYEPVTPCICGHPDPPSGCVDPTDPKWCQHVAFRGSRPHARPPKRRLPS